MLLLQCISNLADITSKSMTFQFILLCQCWDHLMTCSSTTVIAILICPYCCINWSYPFIRQRTDTNCHSAWSASTAFDLISIVIPCCICLIKVNKSLYRLFLIFHLKTMIIIYFWNDRFFIFLVFFLIFFIFLLILIRLCLLFLCMRYRCMFLCMCCCSRYMRMRCCFRCRLCLSRLCCCLCRCFTFCRLGRRICLGLSLFTAYLLSCDWLICSDHRH